MPSSLTVEVVFARPEAQTLVALKLTKGASVEDAIVASGLLDLYPEIDLNVNKVGIYGSVCSLDRRLKENDRVEIYRPLRCDPKETRRLRAEKNRAALAGKPGR